MMLDDIERIRAEFPIVERLIYLDSAYGNPLANSVREAMESYLMDYQRDGVSFARPRAYRVLEEVRGRFAYLINAESSEIAYVKNTSEGLNIAAAGLRVEPGDNIVLNELEHPNNTHCWLRLKEKGVEIRNVPQKDGRVNIEDIASTVDSKTKAVAVASTTNMGFRFDLNGIGKICRENSALLVVDAVQSLGIEPLDVNGIGIDIFSSSAHKGLLGPHGIGFLYCRKEVLGEIEPPYVAGISYSGGRLKETAAKFEYGNYNYVGGYAMVPALSLLEEVGVDNIEHHAFGLAKAFRDGLSEIGIPVLDSPLEEERSQIVAFKVEGKDSDDVRQELLDRGVMLSAHYKDLRASFSLYNTMEDVESALHIIERISNL
jgi:selenocysteine lyase/cysteine desulfurase